MSSPKSQNSAVIQSSRGLNVDLTTSVDVSLLQAVIPTLPCHSIESLLLSAAKQIPSFVAEIQTIADTVRESQPTATRTASQVTTSNLKRKRTNGDNVTKKPATKPTKVHKPLDFEKLEDRAWCLMNKSTGAVKAEDGLGKIVEKISEEVSIVGGLEVKHTALLTLGEILDTMFNAEPSRKAREIRNGTAPPKSTKAMIAIVEEMSEEERNDFISSKEGIEWKKKVLATKAYGGFWRGPQVDGLMELFGEGEYEEEG